MARLNPLEPADMSPEQRRVADAITSGPRGGMRGPFQAWLRAPGLCDPAQRLGAYCRFETSIPQDLNELAILLTGRHWRAQFEFWAHSRLGREAGLPDDLIEAIRVGAVPALSGHRKVVYDFVTEYLATNRVSQATYQRTIDAFGERGTVDLIGVVGYYSLVSMTLNVFEVDLPPGETPPFG